MRRRICTIPAVAKAKVQNGPSRGDNRDRLCIASAHMAQEWCVWMDIDPDFIEFLENLDKEPVMLPSAQRQYEEEQAQKIASGEDGDKLVLTPLMQFIINKHFKKSTRSGVRCHLRRQRWTPIECALRDGIGERIDERTLKNTTAIDRRHPMRQQRCC